VRGARVTAVLAVVLVTLGHVATAGGQGWSVDVSAGRLVYDPVSANVGTSNVIGSLRYDTRRDGWVYGAAALPLGDTATFWGAGGVGTRVMWFAQGGRTGLGADVGAHLFSFRDRVVNLRGTGGTLEALPFVHAAVGAGFVEGGGGWRGHTLSFAGVRDNRGVFETGVRGGYGSTVRIVGDARWVHANEGTYPFVGATVVYQRGRANVWGQAGNWMAVDLDDRVWGVGGTVVLRPGTSLWGSVRQEAPDPLYWNSRRRTWSIGLTQRLGTVAAPLLPVPRSQAGVVVVRVAVSDAPAGAVSIGGDFNNWEPVPMQREGAGWVARLSLMPGVYHYAFRSANGEWFVPRSTGGRRDDGMGGHHAVLVVN
jgi:hypothetical protein